MTVVVQTPQDDPRWLTIAYWTVTGVFSLIMLLGAFGELSQAAFAMEGMISLGYPNYLSTILGIGKLLGVIALLYPGFYRLKEWAYAGFTFNLLGAVGSHLLAGIPLSNVIEALVLWVLMMISYALYYQRTKGNS